MTKILALTLIMMGSADLASATTYNVTNSSSLLQALQRARGGDSIALAGGNYGSLSLNGKRQTNLRFSSKVRIYSARTSSQANFSQISLTDVKNMEFNDISMRAPNDGALFFANGCDSISLVNSTLEGKLNGRWGTGIGVKFANSTNLLTSGSLIRNFQYGFYMFSSTNVDVIDNDVFDISHDAMSITKVHDLLIQNNHMTKNSKTDVKHQDIIQFGNFGTAPAASNVRIIGNLLEADDNISHGIYMGNGQGRKGNPRDFYQNILIQDNDVRTGQMSAIGIGETVGLTISGNRVERHPSLPRSDREISTPMIKVARLSQRVVIRSNEVYRQPTAADGNWQDVNTPSGWSITGNTIIK